MELERLRASNGASPGSSPSTSEGQPNRNVGVKSPRLPCFEESRDQIDNYLLRFKRYATVNNWSRSDWAIHLSALLRGKALDVYSRLNEAEASSYDVVKTALLKRYNLTEEGFQERFRKCRPEQGERIVGYLDKWLELAGKDKTNACDVLDLFIQEQLMTTCGKDLKIFVKERKPKSVDELVETAEKYVEAHGVNGAYSRGILSFADTESSMPKPIATEISNPATPPNMLRCHRCQKVGHLKEIAKQSFKLLQWPLTDTALTQRLSLP